MLIHRRMTRSKRRWVRGLAAAAMAACLGVAAPARAADVVLTDGNSSAAIDPGAPFNQHSWIVDGVNHLFSQQFHYRIGDTGPEANVNSLVIMNQASTANSLTVQYGLGAFFSHFDIVINYELNGGANGSGASDMLVDIFINNNNEAPLNIHFWQYTDLDLNQTADDTSLQMFGSPVINTVTQKDGPFILGETVVTSIPTGNTHHQVDFFANILGSLLDANPTTLTDSNGPLGPGDLEWALQWDVVIDPDESFTITKDLRIQFAPSVVPSPSASVFGLLGLAAWRRRKA